MNLETVEVHIKKLQKRITNNNQELEKLNEKKLYGYEEFNEFKNYEFLCEKARREDKINYN